MNAVERVKLICKARRIPIYTLESECGFSNGYIGKLTKGTFPQDRLLKIADYLSLSPDYLLGIKDEYDLVPDQWTMIGHDFRRFCFANHKTIEMISADTGIKEERLNDFFEAGIPVTRTELLNICQSLNVPLSRVIDGYAKTFEIKKDQAEDGLVNGDPELTEYLQELQSRPELKMLFHTFRSATKEQIEAIVLAWEARNNIDKGE